MRLGSFPQTPYHLGCLAALGGQNPQLNQELLLQPEPAPLLPRSQQLTNLNTLEDLLYLKTHSEFWVKLKVSPCAEKKRKSNFKKGFSFRFFWCVISRSCPRSFLKKNKKKKRTNKSVYFVPGPLLPVSIHFSLYVFLSLSIYVSLTHTHTHTLCWTHTFSANFILCLVPSSPPHTPAQLHSHRLPPGLVQKTPNKYPALWSCIILFLWRGNVDDRVSNDF